MSFSRIRTSRVTTFILSPTQWEMFRDNSKIDVKLNQSNARLGVELEKEFNVYVHGRGRSPTTVKVTKIVEKGSDTFVTLERKHDE